MIFLKTHSGELQYYSHFCCPNHIGSNRRNKFQSSKSQQIKHGNQTLLTTEVKKNCTSGTWEAKCKLDIDSSGDAVLNYEIWVIHLYKPLLM